ncbi:response regulator [Kribbella sp.]|uniref:response regulator n=1 Tax=Kribbella sp. TaxID=1871183 RepID=UPI002D6F4EFD|nr:response regulator [Kribbella sp.]HZX07915.1 response regulator [Kribbella sp.]
MIRTLVVDDDFHVAHAHARSVAKVPGFVVVGEAHSAAEAHQLVTTATPDLLLLDMYLPDRTGLDLVRQLAAESPETGVPDFILITAARDIESVRAAIQLGAIYYLVKPFAFPALREQLEAYQHWRLRLSEAREADQDTVDTLYSMLRSPAADARQRRRLPATMARVLDTVAGAATAVSAADVAENLGVSRPTAQRYLAILVQRGLVDLDLAYGATGRPEHRYSARRR